MKRKKKSAVKQKICNTLLELFAEKSIAEIKISELTEKSKVARASFYRNFKSFDDVLEYVASGYVIDFIEKYEPLLVNGDYESWYKTVKEILEKMYFKKDTFTTILTENLRIVFYKFEQIMLNDPNHLWTTNPYKKYEHIAKVSAFYAICEEWIRSGANESIDDMAAFLVNNLLLNSKVA